MLEEDSKGQRGYGVCPRAHSQRQLTPSLVHSSALPSPLPQKRPECEWDHEPKKVVEHQGRGPLGSPDPSSQFFLLPGGL